MYNQVENYIINFPPLYFLVTGIFILKFYVTRNNMKNKV